MSCTGLPPLEYCASHAPSAPCQQLGVLFLGSPRSVFKACCALSSRLASAFTARMSPQLPEYNEQRPPPPSYHAKQQTAEELLVAFEQYHSQHRLHDFDSLGFVLQVDAQSAQSLWTLLKPTSRFASPLHMFPSGSRGGVPWVDRGRFPIDPTLVPWVVGSSLLDRTKGFLAASQQGLPKRHYVAKRYSVHFRLRPGWEETSEWHEALDLVFLARPVTRSHYPGHFHRPGITLPAHEGPIGSCTIIRDHTGSLVKLWDRWNPAPFSGDVTRERYTFHCSTFRGSRTPEALARDFVLYPPEPFENTSSAWVEFSPVGIEVEFVQEGEEPSEARSAGLPGYSRQEYEVGKRRRSERGFGRRVFA